MGYSNIKRVLSVALLLAFTAPSTLTLSEAASYYPYQQNGMTLNAGVKLTDSNDSITLSLRDSDVKQVLRMFADKAGMNIVFHDSVKGKVTLDLVDTPINEAFNLVLQIAGLSYYKQGNTMIVLANDNKANAAFSKQEMMVFPVKYVSANKIADFLNKNVFGMKKAGLSSVDAATVNSATNELIVFGMPSDAPVVEKVIEQFDREPYTKTYSVNHTTPAEMATMICEMLLPAHGVQTSGSVDRGVVRPTTASPGVGTGGAASITGFASNNEMKLGEGVVACTAGATGDAAFDMQALSVAYFPQRGTITLMGGSEQQARMIEEFIRANDVKQPQAMLEVSIVELNEAGSKDFQNIWSLSSKHWSAGFDGTSMNGGRTNGTGWTPKREYIFNGGTNLEGMENGQLPNGVPYPTYTVQNGVRTLSGFEIPQQILRTVYSQVPSVHISWYLNYLIENRKARVLANPKIMITNGQESVIDLTQDYVEKVTSEYLTSSVNGTGSTGTAQRDYTIGDDLGIKVSLTPFISPEGYVTLNIEPKYSTVLDQVYTSSAVSGQRDLVATLLSRRNLDLKNIRIKDGETLVIGGMIQETETKQVNKIPLLGDLPLIGSAFRSSTTSKNKTELIIMITPKILDDGEGSIAGNL